jgi:two-component system, NtrC family, C4-dicarboxylate transport response regulator DctD
MASYEDHREGRAAIVSKLWRALSGFFVESDEPAGNGQRAEPDKPTVLVIDDDRTLLAAMREILAQAGFNVLAANTGVKGLNILRYAPSQVQVVLLDFTMPEFSGAQTLTYIRQLCPRARVIAMSGSAPESLPAAFRDGVDDFVQKPFASERLLERIFTAAPAGKHAVTA